MNDNESLVFKKISRRLLPTLMICYFVAYLDRVNVGFAALTMNKSLGFSSIEYAWGAGIFFIGYFIFEVPSNVALERTGARVWIARIMLTWGVFSLAMAFVWNTPSFYTLRFLLGAAEAGFFPGIILYLTYWYPETHRAKIVGSFMAAIPISNIIGAPISGLILSSLDGVHGYEGWQWLFIIEAIPALLLAGFVYFYLTDKPEAATWLTQSERTQVADRLAYERAQKEKVKKVTLRQALTNGRVIALSFVYFGLIVGLYGVGLWLPQIVKGFGLTNLETGFVTAVPYIFGAAAMILWTRHSDQTGERTWHVAIPAFVGGGSLIWAAYAGSPFVGMVALTLASMGILSALPTFWALPTAFLTGTAAAGGLALINSIGNLGGFAGPYAVGWIKDATGNFSLPLVVLAGTMIAAGLLALALGQSREAERLLAPAE